MGVGTVVDNVWCAAMALQPTEIKDKQIKT
jgi:hypothetical protein